MVEKIATAVPQGSISVPLVLLTHLIDPAKCAHDNSTDVAFSLDDTSVLKFSKPYCSQIAVYTGFENKLVFNC